MWERLVKKLNQSVVIYKDQMKGMLGQKNEMNESQGWTLNKLLQATGYFVCIRKANEREKKRDVTFASYVRE